MFASSCPGGGTSRSRVQSMATRGPQQPPLPGRAVQSRKSPAEKAQVPIFDRPRASRTPPPLPEGGRPKRFCSRQATELCRASPTTPSTPPAQKFCTLENLTTTPLSTTASAPPRPSGSFRRIPSGLSLCHLSRPESVNSLASLSSLDAEGPAGARCADLPSPRPSTPPPAPPINLRSPAWPPCTRSTGALPSHRPEPRPPARAQQPARVGACDGVAQQLSTSGDAAMQRDGLRSARGAFKVLGAASQARLSVRDARPRPDDLKSIPLRPRAERILGRHAAPDVSRA